MITLSDNSSTFFPSALIRALLEMEEIGVAGGIILCKHNSVFVITLTSRRGRQYTHTVDLKPGMEHGSQLTCNHSDYGLME